MGPQKKKFGKHCIKLLLNLFSNSSPHLTPPPPQTHKEPDKPQSAPLSLADIYFTQFMVVNVKVIRETALQHVDLREHLHRLHSLLLLLCLSVSFPNQNHIDPAFEHSAPNAALLVKCTEWAHAPCWAGAKLITVPY